MIYLQQHPVNNYQVAKTGKILLAGGSEFHCEWRPPDDVPSGPPPVEFPPGTPEEEPFIPEVEPPLPPQEIPDEPETSRKPPGTGFIHTTSLFHPVRTGTGRHGNNGLYDRPGKIIVYGTILFSPRVLFSTRLTTSRVRIVV